MSTQEDTAECEAIASGNQLISLIIVSELTAEIEAQIEASAVSDDCKAAAQARLTELLQAPIQVTWKPITT